MSKKLICLVLFAALLVTCAFAEATGGEAKPSKTTDDTYESYEPDDSSSRKTTTTTTTYTAPAAPAPAVEITASATSATATAALDEFADFEATGAAVVDFFDDDVKAEIEALVPAGFDVTTLKVTEVVALKVPNFTVGQGSQAVTLSFATQYKTGATVVVLVGVKQADGTILWTPVQAKALNGALQVVFPEEILQNVASGDAVLAVLAE